MMDLQYAYLIGNVFFLAPIWAFVFYWFKDTRKQMLTISVISIPFGPLSELMYWEDYWVPNYAFGMQFPIEDMLFAFFATGLAAVIYEVLFTKTCPMRTHKNYKRWMLLVIATFATILMFIIHKFSNINSIYITSFVMLGLGLLIMLTRHDLLKNAIMSGLLLGGGMLTVYLFFLALFPAAIQEWWMVRNISGILILGVPIEELLWGFSTGFLIGPIYEFIAGLQRKI